MDIDIIQVQSKVLELRGKGLRKPAKGEQIKKDERAIHTLLNELLTLADWNSIFSYKTHESEKKRDKSKEELVSILGDCVFWYNSSRNFIDYAKDHFQKQVKDGSRFGEFADDKNERRGDKTSDGSASDIVFDEMNLDVHREDLADKDEEDKNEEMIEDEEEDLLQVREDSTDDIIQGFFKQHPKAKRFIESKAKPVQIIIVFTCLGKSVDEIYNELKHNGFRSAEPKDIVKLQERFREELKRRIH